MDQNLPTEVASVIQGSFENATVVHAISSQFDVDRMDYLLRDSLATGTSYGNFDLDRGSHSASNAWQLLLGKGA